MSVLWSKVSKVARKVMLSLSLSLSLSPSLKFLFMSDMSSSSLV